MKLLTSTFPSGYHYPFEAIEIKPMTFAQILEYLENVPNEKTQPVEKYYFEYCVCKTDDPNIENLLLIDYEYVSYMKKGLTIADDLTYTSATKCPRCGAVLNYKISLAEIEWTKMDPELLEGIIVEFAGAPRKVRMPRVIDFMAVFKKYRVYKHVTDMRIIKLIALFEEAEMYTQKIEQLIVNSTYKDISTLFKLDKVFYNFIKPKELHCSTCSSLYIPTESDMYEIKLKYGIGLDKELSDEYINEIKQNQGGVEISLSAMISNFFRDVCINNRPSEIKV